MKQEEGEMKFFQNVLSNLTLDSPCYVMLASSVVNYPLLEYTHTNLCITCPISKCIF